jgi:hypothetical protein
MSRALRRWSAGRIAADTCGIPRVPPTSTPRGSSPSHPARLKLAHEPTDGKRMRVRLTGALLRGRVPQEHDGADDFRAPLDGVHNGARGLGNIGRARQRLPLAMARQWAAYGTQGGGGCHGRDAWASALADFPIDVKLILTLLVKEAFIEASKPMAPEPIVAEPMTSESMFSKPIVAEPMTSESMFSKPIVAEPMICEHVTSESMSPEPMSPTPRMPYPCACQEQHRQHDDDAHPLLPGSHSPSLLCITMSVLYET